MNQKSKRSKELFHKAVITLMSTKNIAEMSVREICEEAGLNHSTFYLHYRNVYDLLKETEEEVLENARSAVSYDPASVISFLTYLKDNGNMFRTLLEKSGNRSFRDRLVELTEQMLAVRVNGIDHPLSAYFYDYIILGSIGVIEQWIKGGCRESCEEMEQILAYFAQKITEDHFAK